MNSPFPSFKRDRWSTWRPNQKAVALLSAVFFLFLFSRALKSETEIPKPRKPTDYRLNFTSWPSSIDDSSDFVSAFPPQLFTTNALRQNDDLKAVTAVIYRTSESPQNVIATVHHLLHFPFIKEIYIHNPRQASPLTIEQLGLDPFKAGHVNIDIYQETDAIGRLARFTTCAMASYDYCYFQDDLWRNIHLDTSYLNFIRFPNLVHGNIPPKQYLKQAHWHIQNADINLHSGFADLQYGVFAPRWKAQTFLTQLGKSGIGKDKIRLADLYFVLWTNEYPWLLANPVGYATTDKKRVIDDNLDIEGIVHHAMRKMQTTLELDTSMEAKDYFERVEERPYLDERDARTSCKNDRCLFTTNLAPAPLSGSVQFNKSEITTLKKLEEIYNTQGAFPLTAPWEKHSFYYAVDEDPKTCWNTVATPRAGDYFGLILMGDIKFQKLEILTNSPLQPDVPYWNVLVTRTGGQDWVQCEITDSNIAGQRVSLTVNCGEIEAIRSVRVAFISDHHEPFNVCGLGLDNTIV